MGPEDRLARSWRAGLIAHFDLEPNREITEPPHPLLSCFTGH
jgi:hypothetical protein